jgi:hypothetical protein
LRRSLATVIGAIAAKRVSRVAPRAQFQSVIRPPPRNDRTPLALDAGTGIFATSTFNYIPASTSAPPFPVLRTSWARREQATPVLESVFRAALASTAALHAYQLHHTPGLLNFRPLQVQCSCSCWQLADTLLLELPTPFYSSLLLHAHQGHSVTHCTCYFSLPVTLLRLKTQRPSSCHSLSII